MDIRNVSVIMLDSAGCFLFGFFFFFCHGFFVGSSGFVDGHDGGVFCLVGFCMGRVIYLKRL
jgi:hypothetical protein